MNTAVGLAESNADKLFLVDALSPSALDMLKDTLPKVVP
jgi:hypothetical protein